MIFIPFDNRIQPFEVVDMSFKELINLSLISIVGPVLITDSNIYSNIERIDNVIQCWKKHGISIIHSVCKNLSEDECAIVYKSILNNLNGDMNSIIFRNAINSISKYNVSYNIDSFINAVYEVSDILKKVIRDYVNVLF